MHFYPTRPAIGTLPAVVVRFRTIQPALLLQRLARMPSKIIPPAARIRLLGIRRYRQIQLAVAILPPEMARYNLTPLAATTRRMVSKRYGAIPPDGNNVANGYQALNNNTTGWNNTANGDRGALCQHDRLGITTRPTALMRFTTTRPAITTRPTATCGTSSKHDRQQQHGRRRLRRFTIKHDRQQQHRLGLSGRLQHHHRQFQH